MFVSWVTYHFTSKYLPALHWSPPAQKMASQDCGCPCGLQYSVRRRTTSRRSTFTQSQGTLSFPCRATSWFRRSTTVHYLSLHPRTHPQPLMAPVAIDEARNEVVLGTGKGRVGLEDNWENAAVMMTGRLCLCHLLQIHAVRWLMRAQYYTYLFRSDLEK